MDSAEHRFSVELTYKRWRRDGSNFDRKSTTRKKKEKVNQKIKKQETEKEG